MNKAAGYARTKRKGIESLLEHRHGDKCDTDDGELWLEAAIPFVVEIAEIVGHSTILAGLKWGRKFCPLVSLDVVSEMIKASIARRDDAVAESKRTSRHLQWLPSSDEILQLLRQTWGEVTGLGLRGFASIDPPSIVDRRVRKTDQRRIQRYENGVKPRSTLLRTKCAEMLALELSVSLSTIKRMRKSEGVGGSTDLRIVDCAERDLKMSSPNVEPIRGDTFGSSVEIVSISADADVGQPQGDEDRDNMTVADTMMQDGYTGRNLKLTAREVEILVGRFPLLQPDMLEHLTAVDVLMSRTTEPYRKRVLRNLLGDRNRAVMRAQRMEKAAA